MSNNTPTLNPEILAEFAYPFDAFQTDAALALEAGDHVLVTAHTSAGKSTVAMYAIAKAMRENKRVIYTAPVKTLSNQKYADLRAKYPAPGAVGIQTGDVKLNPDAQIVVMTTEILRNALGGVAGAGAGATTTDAPLANLAFVIFDECHYINDKERGGVWEECMMRLQAMDGGAVQMVMLSATLANPEALSAWIEGMEEANHRRRRVPIVSTLQRPVPLRFHVFVPGGTAFCENTPWDEALSEGHLAVVCEGDGGRFDTAAYKNMQLRHKRVVERQHSEGTKTRDVTTGRKGVAEANAARAAGKQRQPFNMQGMLNPFINFLHINRALPAIFFTLSRKKCDAYASRVTTSLVTDHLQLAEIERTFDFYIRRLANSDQYSQVTDLRACLLKGVGVHHSGLIPLLKEIVEVLFTRGLLPVIFATETLAIGVNTPTKTVCFLDVTKGTGNDSLPRPLFVEEFKQMAGRAGRRGLDPIGHVIYFPLAEPVTATEFEAMLKGKIRKISSKFSVSLSYILRSAASGKVLDMARASMLHRENLSVAAGCSSEIAVLEEKLRRGVVRLNDGGARWAGFQSGLKQRNTCASKAECHDYDAWALMKKEIAALEAELARCEAEREAAPQLIEEDLAAGVAYLEERGYCVSPGPVLTVKGVFAQHISQCSEVLITEALFRGLAEPHRKDPSSLCAWLAVFIDDGGSGSELAVPPATDVGLDVIALEQTLEIPAVSAVSARYVDPAWEWCQGTVHMQTICGAYGLFEGNVIRAFQKLLSVIDELAVAYEAIQDMVWVQDLGNARAAVARDVLSVSSIYISA